MLFTVCFMRLYVHIDNTYFMLVDGVTEPFFENIYIYISGVGRCQKVCVCGGGGGGGTQTRNLYTLKNQYKQVVCGYMAIY